MKKAAVIFLLCAYAFAALGVGLREFYCCGKYVTTSLQYSTADKHRCGMDSDKKEGCCKTKFQFHKVSDSHGVAHASDIPEKFATNIDWHETTLQENWQAAAVELENANAPHAPPPLQKVPSYVLHCVYRL